MENVQNIAEKQTKELLEMLNVKYNELSSSFDTESNTCNIAIKGDDLGILIGFHGKNLDALKVILSLMINKHLGRDNSVRVLIDINDYSNKRAEQLKAMLENAKTVMTARERSTYSFPPMSPADRRTLHTLAQEMGLSTQSEGEGRDRHIVLSMKQD